MHGYSNFFIDLTIFANIFVDFRFNAAAGKTVISGKHKLSFGRNFVLAKADFPHDFYYIVLICIIYTVSAAIFS